MTHALSWLNRWVDRLGWVGITGLLCTVAALAIYASSARPLALQRDQLQAQVAAQGAVPLATAPVRDDSAAAQLSRFYAGFPAAPSSARWIGRMQAAARRAGISLQAGEYRLEQRSGDRLLRYAIVLPVRGSYAQIRAFIDGVLTDVPHLALDDVELKRESAASPQIDARLRLTLHLQAAP